eukprot:scaffold19064_cov168-Amphora_coffeaeformis.AAC.1
MSEDEDSVASVGEGEIKPRSATVKTEDSSSNSIGDIGLCGTKSIWYIRATRDFTVRIRMVVRDHQSGLSCNPIPEFIFDLAKI